MPNRTSTRRSYRHRPKRFLVATERDPATTSSLARLFTRAALSRASLEAAARAEHQASVTSESSSIERAPAARGEDPHA